MIVIGAPKLLFSVLKLSASLRPEVRTVWPGIRMKHAVYYVTQCRFYTELHHSVDKEEFKFIEYDTGPCTADQIILQADKYGRSLVECVSSDFEMDKGLVKCFEKSFKHKLLLRERAVMPGNAAIVPYKDCYIYYLITRERWWDRGCYQYLGTALHTVKDHCIAHNVKELCMGRLGSGMDGLDWKYVRLLIIDTFKDTELTVKAQITR